jgi:hypothetical protein
MINVDRDGPRYHLLLAARFTPIDHGNEFYTKLPPPPALLLPPAIRRFA